MFLRDSIRFGLRIIHGWLAYGVQPFLVALVGCNKESKERGTFAYWLVEPRKGYAQGRVGGALLLERQPSSPNSSLTSRKGAERREPRPAPI